MKRVAGGQKAHLKILRGLRAEIDALDLKILNLLNARTSVVLKIGKLKAKAGSEAYVPDREKDVYRRLFNANKGPLSNESVQAVYREIMSGALSLEQPVKIAYFGPPATFTHLAALKKFGSSVNYAACMSISQVFCEVENGHCNYGVVPVENSTEGAVDHTLDMFIDSDLKICSEVAMEISHHLLSNSPLARIKRIYSNPQAFGQCRNWLKSNLPKAELIEVSSTSRAAEMASRIKGTGAIASKLASGLYKLKIIAPSIEDQSHNVTRFLVIGKSIPNPTGDDKTSIMFSVKDKVGALHDMLVPFKRSRINLTKIESRPSRRKAWAYYFFVDMEGHYKDKKVNNAVSELEKNCVYLKILGSYPAV